MSNLTDNILSREQYIAAYKSQDFSNYREHILNKLTSFYKHRLFPTQLEALREQFEISLQELVNATPDDVEILERDFIPPYDDQVLTLEEQRELVMRVHFEDAFQRLKKNVQIVVYNSTRYLPAVSAHI